MKQADDAVEEGESEEHLKNLIKPFFSNTIFEEDYYINTKEQQDLWDYKEVLDVHENMEYVNESINQLDLVPDGF